MPDKPIKPGDTVLFIKDVPLERSVKNQYLCDVKNKKGTVLYKLDQTDYCIRTDDGLTILALEEEFTTI